MVAVIDAVTTIRTDDVSGEESWFVLTCSGRATGWYGPIDGAAASFVRDRLAVPAIGLPIEDHRGLCMALLESADSHRCHTASWAVGSVDCAVWDLHAQAVQAPVAALLNPAATHKVALYASWLRLDLSDPASVPIVADVGRAGWSFTKWGLRQDLGIGHESQAERLAATTGVVAAALGTAAAFDAVFTWDERLAADFADRVKDDDLLWLEDPLPRHDIDAYRTLARAMPVAVGERLTHYDDGLEPFDIPLRAFTIDVVGCGGLTRAIDLVTTAKGRGVPVYPHGRSFVPALHLAAAYPEAIPAVEYRLQWEPHRQRQYAHPWLPVHGAIEIATRPGLGARPRSR